MSEPVLNLNDRRSDTWQKLVKYLEGELQTLRSKNDSQRLNDIATAALRGRIAAVKDLISLGTDTPKAPSEDELFKD